MSAEPEPSQNETASGPDASDELVPLTDDLDRYIASLPVESQLAIYKHMSHEYNSAIADAERERRDALNSATRTRAANRMLRSELNDKLQRLSRALDLLWSARLTATMDAGLIKELEECLDDNIA